MAITIQDGNFYDVIAEIYDLDMGVIRGDSDEAFYVKNCKGVKGKVLECACGTGRLTFPLAEAGCRVVATDRSAPMLSILRKKLEQRTPDVRRRIEILEMDMAKMASGLPQESFARILAPYGAILYLLDSRQLSAFICATHRCLQHGGKLIFDFFLKGGDEGGKDPGAVRMDYDRRLDCYHSTSLGRFNRIVRTKRILPEGGDVNAIVREYTLYDGDTIVDRIQVRDRVRLLSFDEVYLVMEKQGFAVRIEDDFRSCDDVAGRKGEIAVVAEKLKARDYSAGRNHEDCQEGE